VERTDRNRRYFDDRNAFSFESKGFRRRKPIFARIVPDGVPVEVKARVVRVAPGNYGTTRVGVAIVESKKTGCACSSRGLPTIMAKKMKIKKTAFVSPAFFS
jgi:hypothetical protein